MIAIKAFSERAQSGFALIRQRGHARDGDGIADPADQTAAGCCDHSQAYRVVFHVHATLERMEEKCFASDGLRSKNAPAWFREWNILFFIPNVANRTVRCAKVVLC
jgi:hypothetical protein